MSIDPELVRMNREMTRLASEREEVADAVEIIGMLHDEGLMDIGAARASFLAIMDHFAASDVS